MKNHLKHTIYLLLIVLGIFSACAKKAENTYNQSILPDSTKSEQSQAYNIFNNSSSCKVLYDQRLTAYDKFDTLYFEKNNDFNLFIYQDSVYYNNKLILCFGNVAAFEEITFLISEGKRCLYFYPGFFYDLQEQESEDVIIKAWDNCGVLIEFNKNNQYIVKKNLPYVDPTEFCSLCKISTFDLLRNDEVCLLY